MSRRIGLIVAGAAVVVAIVALWRASAVNERATLYFTATAAASLEPCGCPVNPSGGLPRRATYVRQHSSASIVLLEGGGFVAPPDPLGELKTQHYLRGLKDMGYRVIGLSGRDLVYGIDFLRDAGERHGLTFTSANLAYGDGELVFPQYAIMRAHGPVGLPLTRLRIAVISVMGLDEPPLCPECPEPLDLLNPVDAAQRAATAARGQADLVVVLAATGQETLDRLLQIPEVDVVVAARVLPVPANRSNVGMVGHAVLAYTGYEARRIGYAYLDLQDSPGRRVVAAAGDLAALGEDISDEPHMARLVASYKAAAAKAPQK